LTNDADGTPPTLERALLDAFQTRSAWGQLLLYGLNVRINEISSEAHNLRETAFDVISYFDNRGELRDLIEAAREQNPGSPTLQAYVEALPPAPAIVRVRRKAFNHPWATYAALLISGFALGALVVMLVKGDLTETSLTLARLGIGVFAAVFIGLIPTRWRLPLSAPVVYTGAIAVIALVYALPAQAGLMNISGRVFYEPRAAAPGRLEPVAGVIVRPRGVTTQQDRTGDDGSFILEGVPSTTTEIYLSMNGVDVSVKVERATGGEYAVISRPPEIVPTSPIPIPASAWRSVRLEGCDPPRAAFVLETSIPPFRVASPTYVEVGVIGGARFDRAFTRNRSGAKLGSPSDSQMQWKFREGSGPLRPDIVVCVSGSDGARPNPNDLSVKYWYEETK
jgi:hypothetical protein